MKPGITFQGIRAKVLLGAATLLLPVGVLLYFNLDQIAFNIAFANKERIGNQVQRSLVELLAADSQPGAMRSALSGIEARKSEASLLGIDPATLAGWTRRRLEDGASARDGWTQAIRAAIAQAGDNSNLTLDPEMDSYYVADITSVVTAQSLDRSNRIRALMERGNLNPADRQTLDRLIALADEADRARIEGDLGTAIAENAKSARGASPSLARELKPAAEVYLARSRQFLQLAGQVAAGKSLKPEQWMEAEREARSSLLELHRIAGNELDKLLLTRIDGYAAYRRNVWLGMILSLALAATLLVRIVNAIANPLAVVVRQLERISHRDLTGSIDPAFLLREDEIGKLARASQSMSESLIEVVRQLRANSGELRKTSASLSERAAEMQSGVEDTSQRAQTSAVAAEQMSMNVQTIASSMEQTTTNLDHVAEAASSIAATIAEVNQSSNEARQTTIEAGRQAEHILAQMRALSDAAQSIGLVTESIKAISSQTNLLALNASIEAARAGAAGKGFAVVAQEIKELAQQSASSTEDIRQRIETVQESTRVGMAEMERIFEIVTGVKEQVVSIAGAIERQSATVAGISGHIAEAAIGSKEVNLRVSESATVALEMARESAAVNEVAKRLAQGSFAVSSQAQGLDGMASRLSETVEQFVLPAAESRA